MKRQSEDLFFNFDAKYVEAQENEIKFQVLNEIEFLPGDIIDMIVSESPNIGGVSYCARLICFKNSNGIDLGLLSGLLANNNGDYPLVALYAYKFISGNKKFIALQSDTGTTISFDATATFSVNIIIHRSKKEIELHYV